MKNLKNKEQRKFNNATKISRRFVEEEKMSMTIFLILSMNEDFISYAIQSKIKLTKFNDYFGETSSNKSFINSLCP